jgi:hypothetical protein
MARRLSISLRKGLKACPPGRLPVYHMNSMILAPLSPNPERRENHEWIFPLFLNSVRLFFSEEGPILSSPH